VTEELPPYQEASVRVPFDDHFVKRPDGLFVLDVYVRSELVEHYEDENLVVDNYKQVHARLLGGDVTSRSITQIGFGTSGTTPAAGNTALTSAYSKAVDSVTYPATNQVQFAFSLSSAEANGKAIMEFGLLNAGGTLYARKVRSSALNKESDISFSGSWTITF
jgi:hypothetical protein